MANGRRKVFVKVDARVEVLRRLGELGVAPPVIAVGALAGRTLVIQEWVSGRHPDRPWFARRLLDWGTLVRTYQDDETIMRLLASSTLAPAGYANRMLALATSSAPEMTDAARGLHELAVRLGSAEPVPTHGDPNASNFVLSRRRAYLVDRDDAALADPLRDIGQLLWWYVASTQWPRFFEWAETEFDDDVRDRLYWWVAAESLDVALRLHAEGKHPDARAFLTDAVAALEHRPNPRA
ncbi:MAG: phosphotransferase family protein [Candidatus Limnocylindria bacterium]